MRRLLACVALGLLGFACQSLSGLSAAPTSPSIAPTPTDAPLHPVAALTNPPTSAPTRPLPVPSPTALTSPPWPSAPPDEVVLFGHVFYDQPAGRPVEGAVVNLREFDLRTVTDAAGRFELRGARPGAGCTWTAIEVRMPGFGSMTFYDQALSAGSFEASWSLRTGDHGHWFGPPLADPRAHTDPGSFCDRGTYVPWRPDY